FEWYYNQPHVPHVAQFVSEIKKKTGKVPTARTWFGYAAAWTCALGAEHAKSLDAVKIARALQGFKLPPEVSLMPDGAFYRAGQNQLIPDLYVGNAREKGEPGQPDDLFQVTQIVKGPEVAGTLEETGCKMTWPA
ncbi:MAG TPA: ABC transporter substrate-binding protein, partial [Burkholderiales bacterium]|nr:ABC transporter substrate-binding protein [Burkholderiales bacterium]